MACLPSTIRIGDVVITQDPHGRYSLNDLHRAGGGASHHQPAEFMRLAGTKALVEEIKSGNPQTLPVEVVMGRHGGTYVCRTLVLRYAAWVSPAFELKVYNVFEAYMDGRLVPAAPALPDADAMLAQPRSALFRMCAELAEKAEQQERQLEAQKPAVQFVEEYVNADNLLGLQETARRLRFPQRKFFAALEADKVCFRKTEGGPLIPYAEFINEGLFVHQIRLVKTQTKDGEVSKDRGQTMVTPAGVVWLAKKYGHMSVPLPEQGVLLALPAPVA